MPSRSLSEARFASTVRSPPAIASATAAVALRLAVIVLSDFTRSPTSSLLEISILWLRSPIATASARPTARLRPRLMLSEIHNAAPTAINSDTSTVTVRMSSAALASSAACAAPFAMFFLTKAT